MRRRSWSTPAAAIGPDQRLIITYQSELDPDTQDAVVLTNVAGARQTVLVKQGIERELAKKIQTTIKDAKLKVESQINGDKLRVTGKKRDDLQAAIALLRAAEFERPLQFDNFRD